MKKPCNNCPFRPRTFTPLSGEDVAAMLDEVMGRPSFFMYCHKDMLLQDVECTGSVLFKKSDQSGEVFKDEKALVRAHARTRRPTEFHWRRDECFEIDEDT
jgi:hypothetical protein